MTGATAGLQVAIVGFVGVLVGAVVAALAQYILAVKRERREDRANWKSVKRSARLVANELDTAQGANRSSLTLKQWTFTPNHYETNAWLKYRKTLAAELTENAWEALTFGIWAVETVRDVRRANFDQPNPQWSLTDDTAAAIERALVPIENALVALKPYASDARVKPPNLMHRRRSPER
jgi:hypothetical protein